MKISLSWGLGCTFLPALNCGPLPTLTEEKASTEMSVSRYDVRGIKLYDWGVLMGCVRPGRNPRMNFQVDVYGKLELRQPWGHLKLRK